MMQKVTYTIFGLVVMGMFVLSGSAGAENSGISWETHAGAKKLEGTWRMQITVRNCVTGEPFGPPFPALISYANGGTVTSVDSGFNPSMRSPGLGVWQHSRGHQYSALIEAFLFNAAGTLSGIHRLRQTITVSQFPDQLDVDIAAQILAPNGTQVGAGCATSVGRRLE